MMKLGTVTPCLKKTPKIFESRDTPIEFFWHQWEPTNFAISRNTCINCILIKNSLDFSWVFKNSFNKNVTILMMSTKTATPNLLKINVFWNKDYDVSNKILSRDSNYIVDVVMWPKFGNFSISMREVIIILTF